MPTQEENDFSDFVNSEIEIRKSEAIDEFHRRQNELFTRAQVEDIVDSLMTKYGYNGQIYILERLLRKHFDDALNK